MNDILKSYSEHILKVIEKEMIKQRKIIYSKGFLCSKYRKKYLKKLEDLWFEKLLTFEKFID